MRRRGCTVQDKVRPLVAVWISTLLGVFKQLSSALDISIGFASLESEFGALGVHVRFAKRERINVRLVLQVRQGVIDKPVGALVGTNDIHDVQQGRIRVETPVILCNLRSRMGGPFRETAFFDIFDAFLPFKIEVRSQMVHNELHEPCT